MNKNELVSAIKEKIEDARMTAEAAKSETGVVTKNVTVSKKDTLAFLEAFVDVVVEELQNDGEVNITGFGKFCVAERAEREGRNPQTGESIMIPASKSPKFKPATAFKGALNE